MQNKMNKQEARKIIVKGAQYFAHSSLTVGTWGNMSVRVNDTLAITPSGMDYGSLKTGDVVIVGEKSLHLPSSELALHQAIYAARPDIQALVHTHSVYATVLACKHLDLPILTEDVAQLANGNKIKCAKYALAGTETLAQNAVNAMGNGFAVLLANHGAVVGGTNMRQAILFAELLEKAAQIYVNAKAMDNKIYPLSNKNIQTIKEFYFGHYAKLQNGDEE